MRIESLIGVTVLAGVVFAPGLSLSADDAAFQRELRSQNDVHLREALPSLWQPTSSMIDPGFSDPPQKGPWALRVGDVQVQVKLVPEKTTEELIPVAPHLTLSVKGRTVLTSEGSEGFSGFPSFLVQLAEMDPDNPHPEIIFSSYTGGAHCCSDTRILTSSKNGDEWREIEAGSFDGAPLAARDIDGDGRFEIVVRDNRFLYTFGCYACSAAPLQILQLQGKRIVDVSADKTFVEAHRESLAAMVQSYTDASAESNGFLAGYVGQKIRLGEGAQAFAFASKFYDKTSDWGLESCSVAYKAGNDCPPGKIVQLTFPDALKRFLDEAGYPLPK